MVKAVKELRKESSKFVQFAEWSELKGLLHLQRKIYISLGPET